MIKYIFILLLLFLTGCAGSAEKYSPPPDGFLTYLKDERKGNEIVTYLITIEYQEGQIMYIHKERLDGKDL